VQAARERRPTRLLAPAAALLDPLAGRSRVGSGVPAQLRGEAIHRPGGLTLAEALEQAGRLGQQVGPPRGELAELGHRRGVLLAGKLPAAEPLGAAHQPGTQNPVSLRTVIDHAFEYCSCSPAGLTP
jgi:hypothetical protein